MSETEIKKPAAKPAAPKGGIRIKHLRFRTDGSRVGMFLASPKEAHDAYEDRGTRPSGYEIWFSLDRRAFRFDHFDGGQYRLTKWVPEVNVFSYEELPQGE